MSTWLSMSFLDTECKGSVHFLRQVDVNDFFLFWLGITNTMETRDTVKRRKRTFKVHWLTILLSPMGPNTCCALTESRNYVESHFESTVCHVNKGMMAADFMHDSAMLPTLQIRYLGNGKPQVMVHALIQVRSQIYWMYHLHLGKLSPPI